MERLTENLNPPDEHRFLAAFSQYRELKKTIRKIAPCDLLTRINTLIAIRKLCSTYDFQMYPPPILNIEKH